MPTSVESPRSAASELFQHIDLSPSAAASGEIVLPAQGVNAHIHLPPNFSAFDTIAQAVSLAAEENVRVLGASNYYDYSVYNDFIREAGRKGIFPLFGLEIITLVDELVQAGVKLNDPGNPGKMYICGKGIMGFDPMSETAAALLNAIRARDSDRMRRMTDRLEEIFAAAGLKTGLDEEAVKAQIAHRHECRPETVYLQERHVAQAFQEAVFEQVPAEQRSETLGRIFGAASKADPNNAAAIQNEIRSHLMKSGKPAFIPETFVDFEHGYRLILALGGIPCYPTLADGASPIGAFEAPVENLIAEMKKRGLYCAEFIPVRNAPDVLSEYVQAMRRAGIVVTAGTEHNTRDLIPMAPTCLRGQPIPDDIQQIFHEGACVIAAHQALCAQGKPGYVDGEGKLNAAYASDEERIAAFRNLGASVIRQIQAR